MAEDLFKGEQVIDNHKVPTEFAEIGYLGVMRVECGTNGYGGGDSGWGGRAYVRIEDIGGCDIRATTKAGTGYGNAVKEVEIVVGGDAELENLGDALLWASRVIKSKCGEPLDRYVFEKMEDVGGQKAYNKYEKFYHYLQELKGNYDREKNLNHISQIAQKHHCKGVTKVQFFQLGIDKMDFIRQEDATELYDKIFKSEKK